MGKVIYNTYKEQPSNNIADGAGIRFQYRNCPHETLAVASQGGNKVLTPTLCGEPAPANAIMGNQMGVFYPQHLLRGGKEYGKIGGILGPMAFINTLHRPNVPAL